MRKQASSLVFVTILLQTALYIAPSALKPAAAQAKSNIHQATLEEPNQASPEISTEDLKNLLAKGGRSVLVFDVRSPRAYGIAHIPGSINPPEEKEVEFITQTYPDKAFLMVIYCAGLH